jgi:4-hydroxy-tetrahydrodipicolinate synthase
MPRFTDFEPKGVIPAALLPFAEDFSIDEAATRKHLSDIAAVDGISAICVNGHASEVHACTVDEQRLVLDVALNEIGDRLPMINGIYADGSHEAARLARMSEDSGASCLLVFPPHPIGRGGGNTRPEMALAHFKAIADATDLPFIAFQYPLGGGYGYPMDILLAMADQIPSFRAIKDGSYDAMLHESHVRTLRDHDRPINVLTTHSPWLLPSLSIGCAGLLSGAGSIIADLQLALFNAIQDKDLARAKEIEQRIWPTSKCFYKQPSCDMHNRMKEALVILGRLPRAVVRPPLMKLPETEIKAIEKALRDAGIARDGALSIAAE